MKTKAMILFAALLLTGSAARVLSAFPRSRRASATMCRAWWSRPRSRVLSIAPLASSLSSYKSLVGHTKKAYSSY